MHDALALLSHHLEQLTKGSGIAPEVIAERGYRSLHGPEGYGELRRLGFSRAQAKPEVRRALLRLRRFLANPQPTDDGAETAHYLELEASLHGRTQRVTVAAAQFSSLAWVSEHLGAQAMVYPGQSLRDHARAAIQLLSDSICERRIFRHTGWRRNHEDEWCYFHGV